MPSDNNAAKMTNQEIVAALRDLAAKKRTLSDEPKLSDICRNLFEKQGIINKFDPLNPTAIANYVAELSSSNDVEAESADLGEEIIPPEEQDMSPISMDSQRLKELLRLYDEHRESTKNPDDFVKVAHKNPLLKRLDSKDIVSAWLKKTKLEASEIRLGKTPRAADKTSDNELIATQKLRETAAGKTSEQEIETLAKKIVAIAEQQFDAEKNRKQEADQKTFTTNISEEIARIADSEKVMQQTRNETVKILEKQVFAASVNAEAVRIAEQIVAQEVLNRQIEVAVEYIADGIEKAVEKDPAKSKLNENQKTSLRETVYDRVVDRIYDDSNQDIGQGPPIVSDDGKTRSIRTGDGLVMEVQSITGRVLSGEELATLEVVVKGGNVAVNEVIFQGNKPTDRTNQKDKGQVARPMMSENNVVDVCRANRLRESLTEKQVKAGVSIEVAKDAANFVTDIQFPRKEEPTSWTQIRIINALKVNGFDDKPDVKVELNNDQAQGYAKTIKWLIKSPVKVSENVKEILSLHKSLDGAKEVGRLKEVGGLKEIGRLKEVAITLNKNKNLLKSLEFIQGLVKFQDRIGQITGTFSNPIGHLLKIPALQEFAIQTATRFGGQTVGAMATHIAQFGLEGGIKNIVGQLLTKGTVTAISAGTTAAGATTAAGTAAVSGTVAVVGGATGPPGWVIAALVFAVQIVWNVGKKLWGKVEGLLKKVNLDSGRMKVFLQDTFGKGVGGMLDFGLKIGGLLLLIPILIGGAITAAISATVVVIPVVFGILLGMQTLHSSQVSSLVAPRNVGNEGDVAGIMCIEKSDLTATGECAANCNANAPVTDAIGVNKSLFVNIAERWSAGGKLNAQKCYYDVVCRAKTAGVNPDFALWAWLHESGASNYCGFKPTQIEDFGIHNTPGVSKNNFNEQFTFFLNYVANGGIAKCVGDPLITAVASGNQAYWLAISSYLNGSCDPNAKNPVSGGTAWDYLAEMETTWAWINSAPMPDSALITPQSCGGGTPTTYEETDPSGEVLICEDNTSVPPGNPAAPMPTRDPSMPIPAGCPEGWPLSKKACIIQGSFGGFSHQVIEAYDFAGGCVGKNIGGYEIRATHDGVATGDGSEASPYGFYVDVTGKCNGKVFTTRYAHMPKIIIKQNSVVKKGDLLGYVDNSGTYRAPGNEHLHYEILWRALKMNDWVPQPVPNKCYDWSACGSVIIN